MGASLQRSPKALKPAMAPALPLYEKRAIWAQAFAMVRECHGEHIICQQIDLPR